MKFRACVRWACVCAFVLGLMITPCIAGAGTLTTEKDQKRAAQAKPSAASKTGQAAADSSKPVTSAEAIEAGRIEFLRLQCFLCHNKDMKKGIENPNAQGGEVPALVHVAEDYTWDETIKIIRNGRSSPKDKPEGPTPPLYMPSWKGIATEAYVRNVAAYLWSKQEKKEAGW